MKVSIIDNSGIVSLANEIDEPFQLATEVQIATAFITSWSIELLRDRLKENDTSIRLLIGLFGRFNKQEDLKKLLKLQNRFKNKFQVRVSRISKFHWKYYQFQNEKKITVFIGSANFTKEGLDKAGELIAKLEDKKSKGVIKNASRSFNKLWRQSIRIEKFPISKYHEIKRPKKTNPNNPTDSIVTKLLKNPSFASTKSKIKISSIKLRYVRVEENLTTQTVRKVNKFHSEWSQRYYSYVCFPDYKNFEAAENADYIFYQRKENNKWYFDISKVIDSDSSLETDDGKYFVAFKKQNTRSRLISSKLKQALKSCKINYGSSNDKTMNQEQRMIIFKSFGIKSK